MLADLGADGRELELIDGSSEPAMNVGAEHFELVANEGQYKVTNLALLQGTWVNEKRIRSQKLVNKDIIRSGCVEFVFLT